MVSIIVPAYNAEKYLPDAISSVGKQSASDWELIIVDDGSTDATTAIAASAAASDPRIRHIRTFNAGVSAARNLGIAEASGEFVAFLDADDILAPDFIRDTIYAARLFNADLVLAPMVRFPADGTPDWSKRRDANGPFPTAIEAIPAKEAVIRALYQNRGIDSSPCGKLYRKSLWKEFPFRTGIRYEDLDAFYRVWTQTDKAALLVKPLYGYRDNPSSYMNVWIPSREDVLDVTDRLVGWAADKGPEMLAAAEDRRMSAHFNILKLALRNRCRDRRLIRRCEKGIIHHRAQSLANPKVRWKNRIAALLSYLLFN